MNGDRMEIRRKVASNVVICEDNVVRDLTACAAFAKYQAKRKPKCNCMPCWVKWTKAQLAKDSNKQVKE